MPGLGITIPTGWVLDFHDAGEVSIHPNSLRDGALKLFKDAVVVVSNHRNAPAGTVAKVGTTPAEIMTWFTSDRDFHIISPTAPATVGRDIEGSVLSLEVSKTADYGDPGCPANPRCADLVKDLKHWGSDFYGIGADTAVRLFMTTAKYPEGDHTLYVVLEAPSAADLPQLIGEAQPILDSLQLPTTYVSN